MNNKKLEKKLERKMRKNRKNESISVDYSLVKIFTGSDLSTRKIPIMKIKSKISGPIVWLTACAHGDEVGGMVVIQEIFKILKRIPLSKGSVYAIPLMNPLGIETGSHNIILRSEITPISENLNRSFPGNKEGSLAERIANKIFELVTETKPDLVLDLHNDWRESVPYVLIDPCPSYTEKDIYEKTKNFAKLTGFPVILDTDEEVNKTFTYSLLKNNIPAFTIEVGESYTINEKDVENGVQSVLRILKELEMIEIVEHFESLLDKKIQNKILKYSEEPASSVSGIIRSLVKPGEIVEKEQVIAKIYNAFGKVLETLHAKDDAVVLGYSDSSVAFPGLPVMAFGVI